jgi:hypothetical protein
MDMFRDITSSEERNLKDSIDMFTIQDMKDVPAFPIEKSLVSRMIGKKMFRV